MMFLNTRLDKISISFQTNPTHPNIGNSKIENGSTLLKKTSFLFSLIVFVDSSANTTLVLLRTMLSLGAKL